MRNIHILPTDKTSKLIHNDANQLCYQSNKSFKNDKKWMYRKAFNIYITSDEEIKEGDYFCQNFDSIIHKCYKLTDNYVIAEKPSDYPKKICKKIILTTDPDLIKDGVQAIDDDFLEWFVKNQSCEGVKVYYIPNEFRYEIIIPKEEIPQVGTTEFVTMCESIFGGKPKQSTKDRIFSEISEETKQRARDYGDSLVNKQETIEEVRVVKRTELYNSILSIVKQIPRKEVEGDAMDAPSCAYELQQLFLKWQQEQDNKVIQDLKDRLDTVRHINTTVMKAVEKLKEQYDSMYSEEEVLKIIQECKSYLSFGDEFNEKEWFEKFKKK